MIQGLIAGIAWIISTVIPWLAGVLLQLLMWLAAVALTAIGVWLIQVVLYNALLTFGGDIISYVLTKFSVELSPQIYSVTGVAGWICDKLRIAESFTTYFSAVVTVWLLNFINLHFF